MPLDAPVTSATVPSSRSAISSLLAHVGSAASRSDPTGDRSGPMRRDGSRKIGGHRPVAPLRDPATTGTALGARPLPHHQRFDRSRRPPQQPRPGAPHRGTRLPALLGGRAPQHARHRQLGPGGAHRAPGPGHLDHPGGLRRGDAAQPRPAGGGRAVRHARSAAPRSHRPGHRPGAGHRPADRPRPAATVGHTPTRCARCRGLPPAARRGPGLLRGLLPRRTPLPAHHRHPRPGVPARRVVAGFERLQRPAGRDAGDAVLLRPPLQRRQHAAARWSCTGSTSNRGRSWPSPTCPWA